MADRPNTPVPTMADAENPIESELSSGASGEDPSTEERQTGAQVDTYATVEELFIASAAAKLTRPATRLANDVLLLIATRGTARDLGKAQIVSRGWQAAARREVTLRTAGRVLNVFAEKPAYLRSIEVLDAVIGPKPAGSWRDRWPELQYAKFLRVDESLALLHDRETVLQLFRANIHVIDAELAKIRESIDWKVESGWPRTLAEDYTLIMTHFKAALGDSVRDMSDHFAAAVHLLRDALTLRAPLEAVAPDAYTDLDGTYGMKTNDGAWAALTPDAAPGVSFVTRAPLEASAHPRCLSDAGFSAAVVLNTGIDYAPMDSDIVRFRSRGRAGGKHRSLVRTAATPSERQYDLPPLSRVTLERIDEAGSWTEFGRTPNRRLYTVVVEFLA